MRFAKKSVLVIISILCFMIFLTSIPLSAFANDEELNDYIAADWRFEENGILDGSIGEDNLSFKDYSGNENNLILNGKNASKYISFSEDKMYSGTDGCLVFENEKKRALGKGVEFITEKDAPINKNNFSKGYTIELIYKLPNDFATEDAWMGMIARKGKDKTMTETKKCSMSVAISNCKELQFLTANENDSHKMDSAWSVSMDKGGVWYHIAIVSNGHTISTFVNGCEAFRDYQSDEMVGMFADEKDGRFVVGGYDNGLFNHYLRGSLQQVRIAEKALDKTDWLIPNPESYIDKYGENLPFTNLSNSSYNVVFLPDIQNATEFRPEVLYTAGKWLNENKNIVKPVALVSLGDIVNTYSDTKQWENARAFYSILEEGNYPILQQPGNHDYGDTYYLDSFGPNSDFGKRQTERGVTFSPSGYSSYLLFDGGSYKYFVINISMYHIDDKDEREWLEKSLSEHENYPTIITSHSFQNCDAAKPDAVVLSDLGKSVWDIVKKHNQVFLMISGHHHGAGEEVLKNDFGNSVYSVLADYQFSYNGGNAFFKFAEFDEAHNKIRLSTFSPYAATLSDNNRTFFDVNYMTGAGNYTVLDLDFESRFKGYESSSNNEEYTQILNDAKNNETNIKTSLFENAKEIGDNDAHTVSTSENSSKKTIIIISVLVLAIFVVVITTVVIVHKKKVKKSNKK